MSLLAHHLWIIAFILYGLSNLSFWVELLSRKTAFSILAISLAIMGIIAQLASLIIRGITLQHSSILQAYDALGLLSILIILTYLFIQWKWKLPGLGFFVTALAFLFTLLSLAYSEELPNPLTPGLSGTTLQIHIGVILLSFGILALAFCASLAYLAQDFMLRRKMLHNFSKKLPPLHTLDSIANKLVGLGFVLLSIGIALGSVWAERWWGTWWSWDPKQDLALLTWLIYALYIHARTLSGWKGRRSVILLVVGFLFVIVTFLGANFLPGRHRFV